MTLVHMYLTIILSPNDINKGKTAWLFSFYCSETSERSYPLISEASLIQQLKITKNKIAFEKNAMPPH
jgi:hypothetical protein